MASRNVTPDGIEHGQATEESGVVVDVVGAQLYLQIDTM